MPLSKKYFIWNNFQDVLDIFRFIYAKYFVIKFSQHYQLNKIQWMKGV